MEAIPGTLRPSGPPVPQDPMDHRDSQDLRTLGKLPLPFEIQNLNKHPETLNFERKQKAFLNYIVRQTK